MTARRDLRRRDAIRAILGLGLGAAGLSGCGGGDRATTTPADPADDPLAPVRPVRTPTPGSPVRRVVALSSADLDVLLALGVEPEAAWAVDGTGPRPWRDHPAPPAPDWDGPGLPDLRSLLPFGADAFALAAADASAAQVRDFERLATVVLDPAGRPGWRDHLELLADATGADATPVAGAARRALDDWAGSRRRLGVGSVAVVVAGGVRPDTPVATLAADSPLGAEIRALGLEVVSHRAPVPYRRLRGAGVEVVRVDPRDGDLVAAVRQPSAWSLPWALGVLSAGGRRA